MGNTEIGILVIAGVCTLVLVIGILKKRAQILLNFAVRAAVCLILSYFLDTFLASRGIPVSVGLNPDQSFDIRNPWFLWDGGALWHFISGLL